MLFYINLVPQNNEREVLRIVRASLDEEFISPAVERLKALGAINIIHENTAVCTTIECDTERLETLLTSSVPKLQHTVRTYAVYDRQATDLHSH